MLNTQYVCALSGIRATDDDIDQDGDFPDGWIEIKITRRFVNPKWDAIQFVKQGLIAQYLQNIPEEAREEQVMAIALQVEAQFAALEDQTEKFEEEDEVLYIANPEDHPEIAAEYENFRLTLGMGKNAMKRPAPKPKPTLADVSEPLDKLEEKEELKVGEDKSNEETPEE